MSKRSIAVTAAIAGAAALAATGINYAAAAGTEAAPAAPAVRQAAAPAAAPLGGDSGQGKEKGGNHHYYEGRIHFNERSYSARTDGCITVVSGLGARSFNVRNDSWKTVEVFRGATCDNGSPVATVGPWSTSNSVSPHKIRGGVWVKNGVVGSFRVVDDFRGRGGYGGDHGKGEW
ncbi:hypothetical protein ACFC18_40385 [Streptomyces sp. NPDC056121]|uniref:hypothetical protein n=1 Tax=Streptomyces TaxID=1883 RepID=UPI001D0A46BB|nr:MULTISPECIES: hypothetical protein [Streptomyces]MCX5081554.1 hypothetical protein [Streptomyces sp. NBC_00401]UDL99722.1 hypothetical protein LGI35_16270 [Streptomyces longhuiensis]